MILIWLILLLIAGALLAWLAGRYNNTLPRIISLAVTLVELIILLVIWLKNGSTGQEWIAESTLKWIPAFGIQVKVAADGLSLLMLLLTSFLGVISVLVSWKGIIPEGWLFSLQPAVYPGRNFRGICGARPVSFLFFLGNDAHTDVFSHQHLGA